MTLPIAVLTEMMSDFCVDSHCHHAPPAYQGDYESYLYRCPKAEAISRRSLTGERGTSRQFFNYRMTCHLIIVLSKLEVLRIAPGD